MEIIAGELNAELVELTDGKNRKGSLRAIAACFAAVRKTTPALKPFDTERTLEDYDLVILGTPVWAGRCSVVMRAFLKEYGPRLSKVAYVITRGSKRRYEEVCQQMDLYTNEPGVCWATLQVGSAGEEFWRAEFIRQVKGALHVK